MSRWRIALNCSGPNSAAAVRPYSSLTRPNHSQDADVLARLGRAVVPLGVASVVGRQLDDRQIVLRRAERRRPARRQILGDEPIVLALAGLGAVRAEVVIAAVERDDGLPGLARCFRYLGRRAMSRGMVRFSHDCDAQNGMYRFGSRENAALPNVGR